jgi:hypothetical protein
MEMVKICGEFVCRNDAPDEEVNCMRESVEFSAMRELSQKMQDGKDYSIKKEWEESPNCFGLRSHTVRRLTIIVRGPLVECIA